MDLRKSLWSLNKRADRRNRRQIARLRHWAYQPVTDRRMRRALGWRGVLRVYLQRSAAIWLLAVLAAAFFYFVMAK